MYKESQAMADKAPKCELKVNTSPNLSMYGFGIGRTRCNATLNRNSLHLMRIYCSNYLEECQNYTHFILIFIFKQYFTLDFRQIGK